MFLRSIQPVLMVVSLIIIVFIYSIFMIMNIGVYWYSYALVLVMLRGVIVVFMYISRLIPNERFEIYNLIFLGIFLWLFVLKYEFNYGYDMRILRFNLWFSCVGMLRLFLVVFLFGIILIVVWIRCFNKGAVRVE